MLTSFKVLNVTYHTQKKFYDFIAQKFSDFYIINIDNLILLFNDPSVEMASVASTDLTSDDLINPNVVKVCLDDNNYALNFERDISLQDQQYFRHIGIYAYRSEILKKFTNLDQTDNEKKFKLEQLRALDNNIAIKILITNFQHRSIDIKDDLKYYEV